MINPLHLRFYPETEVGGFTRVSGSMEFWTRVNALLTPKSRVLDFGAGRGAHIAELHAPYLAQLFTLKGRVAHVEACDVDRAVLDNPYVDHATLIEPGKPLPFADGEFDMVVSNYVFEHIDDPELVASELIRIVKPGGWIAATTVNGRGYVALAARLVPNRRHVEVLSKAQPERRSYDVFPTTYKMNSPRALRRLFGRDCKVWTYTTSAEPSYHFNRAWLYRAEMLLHKLLPASLQTGLYMFAQRKADARS